MGKLRDVEVDVLRSIGILLIILAHIKAPLVPTVIRCFDVPLMVFVSGLCYSGRTLGGVQQFYTKRILRLIIPTWLFLIILFIIEYFIFGPLDIKVVIRSFLLYQSESIGYVWIIKVFLLIMLVTPFLLQLARTSIRRRTYLLMATLVIVEELLARGSSFVQDMSDNLLYEFIIETIPYLISYSVFFLLGLVTKELDKKKECYQFVGVLVISLAVFVYWYSVYGNLVITDFKYPPQLLYIAYGCIMPLALWMARHLLRLNIRYAKMNPCERHVVNAMIFVGQNTLWIYLWHILFVLTANHFISSWPLRYIFVLVMATLVMAVQNLIIRKIRDKKEWAILDYFVG